MTVAARSTGASAAGASLRVAIAAAGAALCLFATPARAQLSGSVDVESDYRYRGYSLSAGQPAATLQVGYDDESGAYANVSATLAIDDDPRFVGVQGNIGYAHRVGRKLTLDGGVLRTQYRATYAGGRAREYTEIYGGLSLDPVSVRLSWSPDYRPGRDALYGEVEASFVPARLWRIDLHLGALEEFGRSGPGYGEKVRYDWRAGVARRLGAFDLHAALSGGGPERDYYAGRLHDRTALTLGASWSF